MTVTDHEGAHRVPGHARGRSGTRRPGARAASADRRRFRRAPVGGCGPSRRAVCCWTATIMQGFPNRVAGKLVRVPVIVLILVSTAAGSPRGECAGGGASHVVGPMPRPPPSRRRSASTLPSRGFVRNRLDAEVLTGLALTLALAVTVLAGTVVGILAIAVRQTDALARVDSAAARWAQATRHRDDPSRPPRDLEPRIDPRRPPDRRRDRRDRVGARPQPLHPAVPDRRHAGRLARHEPREGNGRSRPSDDRPARGHARAVLPERAFVDRRRVLRRARASHGTAARRPCRRPSWRGSRSASPSQWRAAACSSTCTGCPTSSAASPLGWGWFALCAVAFGGWLLRFGAPVEPAALAAAVRKHPRVKRRGARPRPPRPRSGRSSPRRGGR